jgi:hypothetical protein
VAEEGQASVSHGSRSHRVELMPSSWTRTLASQILNVARDLYPRLDETAGHAHAIGDDGYGGDSEFA